MFLKVEPLSFIFCLLHHPSSPGSSQRSFPQVFLTPTTYSPLYLIILHIMRNPTLLLLSIALSVQLASAAPVPAKELAPIGNAVKSTASTLQQTTAKLSMGMAGGMAGMSGVTGVAGVARAGGPLGKRQIQPSLNLGVAGLKPEDVAKDPIGSINKLPTPLKTLKKRLLGGGGLTGILGALDSLKPQKNKAPPPTLPAPSPTKVKDKGIDSKVNVDDPQTEEFPSDFDEALEGTSAASNSSTPTNSNVNEVTNSGEGETPAAEPLTSRATSKRFLEDFTPKEEVHEEGYSDPEKVLEELGANEVIKTVIDAPDITGVKNKRVDPLGKLNSVRTTVDSIRNLMKAMPLPQVQ